MARVGFIFAIVFGVVGGWSSARADFSVQGWGLALYVDDFDTGDHAMRGFTTVLNPFVDQHSVTLPSNPATTAAAQYDISWVLDYGSFNISAQLAAQDGNSVESQASGTVFLQSDTDLLLSLDALLNYNLPTYNLGAYLGFSVRDLTTSQYLFSEMVYYETLLDPPGTGALSNVADIALPAGHQFRVQYGMTLWTWGSSVGLATADGHVNFTISPEPASLFLLAPLLAVAVRRRGETPRL